MTVACSFNVGMGFHTKRIVPETHISTHPGLIPGSVVTPVHGQVLQQPLPPLLPPLLLLLLLPLPLLLLLQPLPMRCSPPPVAVLQLSATVSNVITQGTFQIRPSPATNSTSAKPVNNASINVLRISSLTQMTICARRKVRALHALTLATRTHWARSSLLLNLSTCIEISFQNIFLRNTLKK